jgi:hypothetical protein
LSGCNQYRLHGTGSPAIFHPEASRRDQSFRKH